MFLKVQTQTDKNLVKDNNNKSDMLLLLYLQQTGLNIDMLYKKIP